MGIEIYATSGTCDALTEAGIECHRVNRVSQSHPNILDMIASGTVDMIVNSPVGKDSVHDDSYLRKAAIKARFRT